MSRFILFVEYKFSNNIKEIFSNIKMNVRSPRFYFPRIYNYLSTSFFGLNINIFVTIPF